MTKVSRFYTLTATMALVLLAAVTGIQPPAQAAASAILASSTVATGRTLVYVNNPEPLVGQDLGNAGNSLYRAYLGAGNYRGFFEHRNISGITVSYGVYLYNPGTTTIFFTRTRKSWSAGSFTVGGVDAANFLNARESTLLTLEGGHGGWLYRSDLIGPAANHGDYLTGALDWTSSGPAVTQFIAFSGPANALPNAYNYLGYVTTARLGVPQHRVDKGLASATDALVRVSAAIGAGTVGTNAIAIPVTYIPGQNTACPAASRTSTTWRTHYPHTKDGAAVGGDIVSFRTPEGQNVNPCTASPYGGGLPNLGNYGVVYTVQVSINNTSGGTRQLALQMSRETANTFVAYRGSLYVSFSAGWVGPGVPLRYLSIVAPPGLSTHTAQFLQGAPSAGNIAHTLLVTA